MSLESDDLRSINFEKQSDDNINKENLMVKYFGRYTEQYSPTVTKNNSFLSFVKSITGTLLILGLLILSNKPYISQYFNLTPNIYLNNTMLYFTYFMIIFVIIITM
jgi:hypothetical protein